MSSNKPTASGSSPQLDANFSSIKTRNEHLDKLSLTLDIDHLFYYSKGMQYEDWAAYQHQVDLDRLELYGQLPKTTAEKVAELRAEVDGLAGRLKADLLAELRAEIEHLIAMEITHANHSC